jgi:protein-disulfide isomerase
MVAEEARARGGDAKFWKVHDRLFALPTLDDAGLKAIMAEAKLEQASIEKGRLELIDRLRRDQNLAFALGARGTPTIFVNGRRFAGELAVEPLKALVDEELAKAAALVKAGTAPKDVYAQTTGKGATRVVLVDAPAAPAAPGAPAAAAAAVPRTGVTVALRSDDPVRGPADARVTIVEFSDFQCPFCARSLPAIKEVEQAYGKEVRIVWKHLPLSFHPNAMPAALVAEGARQQGKFWEMHDRLFAGQQALGEASYGTWAKELGLDLAKLEVARKAPATRARVEEDLQAASAAGVTGTPTFVVNGEAVVGSAQLKAVVARQLEKARVANR